MESQAVRGRSAQREARQ